MGPASCEDGGEDKYRKRGREFGKNVYKVVGGLMVLALLYTMAPYRNASSTAVSVTSHVTTVSLNAGEGEEEIRIEAREKGDPARQMSRKELERATGLSASYPKYEGSAESDPNELVSPRDSEPADDSSLGVSEEEMEASMGAEENSYDEVSDGDLFEDQVAFDNAPTIKVLPESKVRKYSKIVLSHERYYRSHPSKLYVPTLKKEAQLSVAKFRKLFMERSQPVIIPFEAMRHLNFTTRSGWTLQELKQLYPNSQPKLYKYGAIVQKEIDLGPAVASLMENKKLKKTQVGKSYPRNTKFVLKSLTRLNIQEPPFIPSDVPRMLPSLWFASTSEATPLHSDCCDNWAMMVAGTKKWYLAPPTEARILKPNCKGGLCWVKRLVHADHHAKTSSETRLRDNTQIVAVDLPAGHVLYLPAGWFHHVEQEEPTVMINFWSKGGPEFLKYYARLQNGGAMPRSAEDSEESEEDSTQSEGDDMASEGNDMEDESYPVRTNAAGGMVGDTVVAGTL